MVFTQEPQCQTATPPLFILVSRFCHRSSKCTWHTGLLQSSPAFSWGRYPNGSCIYWRFWLWCVQSCHHKLGPSPESWDTCTQCSWQSDFPKTRGWYCHFPWQGVGQSYRKWTTGLRFLAWHLWSFRIWNPFQTPQVLQCWKELVQKPSWVHLTATVPQSALIQDWCSMCVHWRNG